MARRARPAATAREPMFGPPATTPEAAFLRFGNACHWEAYLDRECLASPEALLKAGLARMPRAEHRLVAEFVGELVGGRYTYAEACAVWKRSENDTMWMRWNDAAGYLHFLLLVRDTIAPHAWPATKPRFRPDPCEGERVRTRRR